MLNNVKIRQPQLPSLQMVTGADLPIDNPEQEGNRRPLVSVVVPAFNEAGILKSNLVVLCQYMESLEEEYEWEILLINDGSDDDTGHIADTISAGTPNVQVNHHTRNLGLGHALQTGFAHARGDYVVVLDVDLSYSPDHIKTLLEKIRTTQASIVVTSPYSKGGTVSHVPWVRKFLSTIANRFLAAAAKCQLSTLTGMVRVYDRDFLRGLNLKGAGMDISPEIIYKSVLLGAKIEEIPAHLDWTIQQAEGIQRRSSMKVMRHIFATLLSGFFFRPFMLFIVPGVLFLVFSLYMNAWMFAHFFEQYQQLSQYSWFFDRASVAVGEAYKEFPHTFLLGGLSMMFSIQLISLGVLSLQSKHYFEEMFHLGSSLYRTVRLNNAQGSVHPNKQSE